MSSVEQLNIQLIDESRPIVQEGQFNYNKRLHTECKDWVSLYGFFQTEKYFKNVEDIIRNDFTFKDEILDPCGEMMSDIDGQVIALHIRRGDYLTNSNNHNVLGLDYYEKGSL